MRILWAPAPPTIRSLYRQPIAKKGCPIKLSPNSNIVNGFSFLFLCLSFRASIARLLVPLFICDSVISERIRIGSVYDSNFGELPAVSTSVNLSKYCAAASTGLILGYFDKIHIPLHNMNLFAEYMEA